MQLVNENSQWIYGGEMPKCNHVISIFGSQNSGKSTLLNSVFGTQFVELDTTINRHQCTKGIWFQNIPPYNLIDTEGSDALQRQDSLMEQYVALFSVSVSDMFLLNIWNNEVGRYYGGQFNVLKNVFRSSLKTKNVPRKHIMFIIKDTPKDQQNKYVQDKLTEDLMRTWAEVISEMPQYSNTKFQRIFTFDFFFMSHYNKHREKYKAEAKKLKSIIDSTITTLKPTIRLPGRQLTKYYRQIWEKIITDQEIDIANERRLIVQFCCRRVKNECIEAISRMVKNSKNFEKDYRTYIKKATQISVDFFNQSTSQIDKSTTEKVKEQLYGEIVSVVNQEFHNIQNRKAQKIISKMRHNLNKSLNNTNFKTLLQAQKQEAIDKFHEFLLNTTSSQIFMEEFNRKLQQSLVRYEDHINRQMMNFEKYAEQSLKYFIRKSVQKLEFNIKQLQSLYDDAIVQFELNQTKEKFQKMFRSMVQELLKKHFQQLMYDRVRDCSNYYNAFGSEDTTVKHFADYRTKVENYLKKLQSFIDTRQIDYSIETTRRMSFDIVERAKVYEIQKQRKQQVTVPSWLLLILFIFAFSELGIILRLMKFSKKMTIFFQVFYVMVCVAILRLKMM